MEKSKRDENQIPSVEEVQLALLALIVGFAMIAMGISIWLLGLWIEDPEQFYRHMDRIAETLSPVTSFIEWIIPFVVVAFIIGAIVLFVFLLWIIWKGHHHLPEIFEENKNDD